MKLPSPLYLFTEVFVGIATCIGNALVIYVFIKNRNIRRYCNYYIVSLAVADLLVGIVGVPFAIMLFTGHPKNLYGCLFTVSTLMGLCYVSIVCLVGVSFDRFWAITNPFAYFRKMTAKKSIAREIKEYDFNRLFNSVMVGICWTIGTLLGLIPFFGWYNKEGSFICFTAIVFPSFLLSFMYGYVYCIVKAKISQMPEHSVESSNSRISLQERVSQTSNPDLVFCVLKQGEAKAAMKLGILVIAFVVCWLPLYAINTVQAFCSVENCPIPEELLNFTIVLSHANSALNPLLYAYHLKDFRLTMGKACVTFYRKLFCQWSKKSEVSRQERANINAVHESNNYFSQNLTHTQAALLSIVNKPLTHTKSNTKIGNEA